MEIRRECKIADLQEICEECEDVAVVAAFDEKGRFQCYLCEDCLEEAEAPFKRRKDLVVYATILSKHGPDSQQAREFRAANHHNRELIDLCKIFDELYKALRS